MEPSEQLQAKIESIRDAVIGFKYVTDRLVDRAEKTDIELIKLQSSIGRFENNAIRTDERIANIERYVDSMRGDIRSVRNSVVGAIVGSALIGLLGLAAVGFRTPPLIPPPQIKLQ